MAATRTDRRVFDDRWVLERKLDGYRCLAWVHHGTVQLRSRTNLPFDTTFPEIANALGVAARGSVVVDGEVVALEGDRTSFSRLQKRMTNGADGDQVPLHYVVFDLLWFDGHDVRPLDLLSRKAALREVLAYGDTVQFGEHVPGPGVVDLAPVCAAGWEGLIAKRAASTYQGRRSTDWLKLKCAREQEVVVVGFTPPKGSRHGLGALLVAVSDQGVFRYAGKVGTGFDDAMLGHLSATLAALEQPASPLSDPAAERDVHWVRPELVVQVSFAEWTEGGRLRHASFVGLRPDKNPAEVVREPDVQPEEIGPSAGRSDDP